MNNTLSCIAVDLETTGLNPSEDTIIEIAAVRFQLILQDGKWYIQDGADERTMLVNPWFTLPEEVTMITGITDAMLQGKHTWSDIQSRIYEFFDNADIIVGHNVLFDVGMLKTHGIDLEKRAILDTFELSEIFSQNAKSLNLGFLGDHYHIAKRWPEHRALTDVWMSIDLLVVYLNILQSLSETEQYIWTTLTARETIPALQQIPTQTISTQQTPYKDWIHSLSTQADRHNTRLLHTPHTPLSGLCNFTGNTEEEKNLISQYARTYPRTEILVRSRGIAEHVHAIASSLPEVCSIIDIPCSAWVSPKAVFEASTAHTPLDRKYLIFLLRLNFWLLKTKTGLLSELKWYGNEREYASLLVTQPDEFHVFRREYQKQYQSANIIIKNIFDSKPSGHVPVLVRDIALMEWSIRLAYSTKISFPSLTQDIRSISQDSGHALIDAVHTIEALYSTIPERVYVWNTPIGKHGETYCLSQEDIHTKGGRWLILATKKLWAQFSLWKQSYNRESLSHGTYIQFERVCQAIEALWKFHIHTNTSLNGIFHFQGDTTEIHILSREIPPALQHWAEHSIGYGYGVSVPEVYDFLAREFHIPHTEPLAHNNQGQITQCIPREHMTGKTLIVTTSMKHIRELGNMYSSYRPLMQGVSGGKSKMKHYFLEGTERQVLIGLIDSWKDTFDIFDTIDTLIIAKVPFDPPTDPYFLAKTQGMSHSFEKYSKPIVLSKLNTLIGNYITSNPNGRVICSDDRIHTTEWGKFLRENLL